MIDRSDNMSNPKSNHPMLEEAKKLLDGDLLFHWKWIFANPVESAAVIGKEDADLIVELAKRLKDGFITGEVAGTEPLNPEEIARLQELSAIRKQRAEEH